MGPSGKSDRRHPALSALIGAGLALLGVGLIEALLQAGLSPMTPLGWPALGVLVGTALSGPGALLGGAPVLALYYVANLAHPQRFPYFFAGAAPALIWCVGLALLSALVLLLRAKLRRAEMAAVLDMALRQSEEQFRSLTELSSDYYWEQDDQFRFIARISSPGEKSPYPQQAVLGKTRWELPALNMTEEDWARHRADLEAHREFRDLVIQRPLPDGAERWVSTSGRPVYDARGRFTGYRGVGRDITARVRAERALRESVAQLTAAHVDLRTARERLEQALDGSSVALWDADLRTGRVYLSEAWSQIVGAPRCESVQSVEELLALVHTEDLEATRRVSLEAMKGLRPSYTVEHRVRARNGEWKWILSRGRVTERDPASGRAVRMIGTNFDITERKRIEEALQSVAQTDPLTGVANRTLLMDRLRLALARARRGGGHIAVLYLDIDRFKQINDTLGHAAGDALLRGFALRLRGCVRASDTVARLGGDEFVVLLDDVKERSNALAIAEKILDAVRAPFDADGQDMLVTASIGIADGGAGDGEDAMLKRADAALYDAKAAGRNAFRIAA